MTEEKLTFTDLLVPKWGQVHELNSIFAERRLDLHCSKPRLRRLMLKIYSHKTKVFF